MTDAEAIKLGQQMAIQKAILEEREACAKVAEQYETLTPAGEEIAQAIRARGEK